MQGPLFAALKNSHGMAIITTNMYFCFEIFENLEEHLSS